MNRSIAGWLVSVALLGCSTEGIEPASGDVDELSTFVGAGLDADGGRVLIGAVLRNDHFRLYACGDAELDPLTAAIDRDGIDTSEAEVTIQSDGPGTGGWRINAVLNGDEVTGSFSRAPDVPPVSFTLDLVDSEEPGGAGYYSDDENNEGCETGVIVLDPNNIGDIQGSSCVEPGTSEADTYAQVTPLRVIDRAWQVQLVDSSERLVKRVTLEPSR